MITAHPNAPLGSVTTLSSYSLLDFPTNSVILCRNTAPLLAFAFALLRRNVACHVLGRDIATGLEKLLDKVGGYAPQDASMRLAEYAGRETQKLTSRGKRQEAANLQDRCDCLNLFLQGKSELAQVKRHIEALFHAGPGLTLSTVHKAKGLEWDTVFILDKTALMPSRWAAAPWEQIQEQNIIYVAITRARLDLKYINSGNWRKE